MYHKIKRTFVYTDEVFDALLMVSLKISNGQLNFLIYIIC